jgi:N-acetylmuramoyl-L-alanine amidase
VCDDATWLGLVEASWRLGERSLRVTSPMMRGEDVLAVQTTLSRLGFDCGHVDGVFGPDTESALLDFQRNCGLAADGVCGPFTARALEVNASRSGSGPGIAILRELARLGAVASLSGQRLAIGHFGGLAPFVHQLSRDLRQRGANVVTVDHLDPATQAAAANRHGALVYVGFETTTEPTAHVTYYSTSGFSSPGGEVLADQLAEHLAAWAPVTPTTEGRRVPILRETKMTAVLVQLGPVLRVNDDAGALTDAVVAALAAWTKAPTPA